MASNNNESSTRLVREAQKFTSRTPERQNRYDRHERFVVIFGHDGERLILGHNSFHFQHATSNNAVLGTSSIWSCGGCCWFLLSTYHSL
jgi:hypothetical protein